MEEKITGRKGKRNREKTITAGAGISRQTCVIRREFSRKNAISRLVKNAKRKLNTDRAIEIKEVKNGRARTKREID